MRPILHKPGDEKGMNKTEKAYAAHLGMLKLAGEIIDYKFEGVKLKLAPRTFYTPDFLVVTCERFEFHEVKGFLRDDAAVKFRTATELYPWFRWLMVRRGKKKNGPKWDLMMAR